MQLGQLIEEYRNAFLYLHRLRKSKDMDLIAAYGYSAESDVFRLEQLISDQSRENIICWLKTTEQLNLIQKEISIK